MSPPVDKAAIALTGIDVLLQFIDRVSAAAAIVKKAHAEGRAPTSEELGGLLGSLNDHVDQLDAAIAKAKAEGR